MKNPRYSLIAALVLVALSPTGVSQVRNAQKPQIKFAKPMAYDSGGSGAVSIALADLNGDGKLDVVMTAESGDNGLGVVSVLLGNGDGSFQSAVTYTTGAYAADAVAAGDLRGKGIPDLVVANDCSSIGQYDNCVPPGVASVLLGNGDGTFQPAVTYSLGGPGATSVALADLRNIGIMDAVVTDLMQDGQNYESAVGVLLGNGDGTFQPAVNYYSGGIGSNSAEVGDFNGDGIPDIVVANSCQSESCQADGTAGVMLGNGDGTFQPVVTYDSGTPRTNSVSVGDLRGNGILDLVVASGIGQNVLGVLLGNGDGTFQSPVNYPLNGIEGGEVAIGDLNGDGIPDLAVTDGCTKLTRGACAGSKLLVMLGNGDGTFQAPIEYNVGGYAISSVAIADVNGDGRPDLLAGNACLSEYECPYGTVGVLLNETTYTTKTTFTASPNPAQINQPVTLTATITPTPPNGELVTFSNGKTTLGTGTTASGTATLTTSFSAAKTYTIKATYPGDPFRRKSSGTVKLIVNP